MLCLIPLVAAAKVTLSLPKYAVGHSVVCKHPVQDCVYAYPSSLQASCAGLC